MTIKKSTLTSTLFAVVGAFTVQYGHAIDQLEYADMQLAQPMPTIVVSGKGSSYSQASSDKLTFRAEAKGRCTWANRYSVVYHRLRDPNHQAQHVSDFLVLNTLVSSNDGYENKNRTWSSSMKPISLNWTPNKAVKDAAIKSCNDKRDSLIKMGNAPAGSFQAPALANSVYTDFVFECSTLVSLTPNQDRTITKPHPINVQCDALEPVKATLNVASIPMDITHVAVTATPKNYSGVCPANMRFEGTINSKGPGGDIQYRFLVNGKAITSFASKTLQPGNKSTKVSALKTLTPENTPQQGQANQPAQPQNLNVNNQGGMQAKQPLGVMPTEKVTLEIKQGNNIRTAEDSFTINCQTIKTATLVPAQPGADEDEQADLTARGNLQLGLQSAPWGNAIILSANDASGSGPRGCNYRFAYDVTNIDKGDAAGFNSVLRAKNTAVNTQPNISLAGFKQKKMSGTVLLASGTYPLQLSIDDGAKVLESKENNNHFQVMVTVPKECGGESQGTTVPARPAPARPTSVPRPVPALPQ